MHCKPDGRETYSYDSAGRLTDEVEYDADGMTKKAFHLSTIAPVSERVAPSTASPENKSGPGVIYDSHGNWIEKRQVSGTQFNLLEAGTTTTTTYRTIEYY